MMNKSFKKYNRYNRSSKWANFKSKPKTNYRLVNSAAWTTSKPANWNPEPNYFNTEELKGIVQKYINDAFFDWSSNQVLVQDWDSSIEYIALQEWGDQLIDNGSKILRNAFAIGKLRQCAPGLSEVELAFKLHGQGMEKFLDELAKDKVGVSKDTTTKQEEN